MPVITDGIRLAALEDIAAMKLNTISRGERKNDFWDLSEILEDTSIYDLLNIYQLKYPWFNITDVFKGLIQFDIAEGMPDPICFKGKTWDGIKNEMEALSDQLKKA